MSKIDELIKEMCPNGVEYKPIGELKDKGIVKLITPSIKIKRNYYEEVGTTPIISQEVEYISGYSNVIDKNIILGEYVCFGDHTENIKYVDFAFVQGADGLKILTVERYLTDYLNVKYFYYAISNFYYRHNNYERHFKYLLQTEIPIPPLPIQREIVRILDSFTELTEELTEELTKELTKRNKQYEYYRDYLLKVNSDEVNDLVFSDIAKIKNGKDYKHLNEGNYPVYGSGGVMTYVNEYVYDKPSVLIPRKGSLNNLFYVDKPFWNVDTIFYTEINENLVIPKYLYYLLKKVHLESLNTAGGVPSLTQSTLNKIKLQIPSLNTQKKIVKCLDNFDSICSDLKIGLPAEIEARQKQYEYYRDMLLTFAEKGEIIPDRQTDKQ